MVSLGKNRPLFLITILIVFVLLESTSLWRHELWRDEMAVWMTCENNTLAGIIFEAKMQAQPLLWYLLVKVIQLLTTTPLGMSIANLFFIIISAFLVLKYAPFNRLEKVFLCFSYLLFYEYGTISRNYALTVAILFTVCALFSERRKYWLPISLLLALNCSIQSMNIIFAASFLVFMIAESTLYPASKLSIRASRLAASCTIIIIGITAAVYQATPPPGTVWSPYSGQKWVFHSLWGCLKSVWLGLVPISKPTLHFWNTNALPDGNLMIIASIVILLFSTLFLIRRPLAGLYYVTGCVGLLLFFYRFYHGFARHHGYFFLMFVSAYWIYHFSDKTAPNELLPRLLPQSMPRWRLSFFTVICFLNFCALLTPVYYDWVYPFSASRQAATFLTGSSFEDCIFLGDVDFYVAPIAGWIDREMYYPAINAFSKSVKWNSPNRRAIDREVTLSSMAYHHLIWQTALKLCMDRKKDVVLVLNYAIDKEPLKEFPVSIVPDETYYIYRVNFQSEISKDNYK
jgi:hypothetical protein